ncbi:LysM peptidoglycan-binding domain-containing protein [Alicyclobacillus vulcanalis]|uniref:LysM domain-containing protein n=1 Tax=Alicyclobacillus vulcanalis TaxID=252246 RepID=A0A1N7P9I2_9BACL|nr:LysM peptidoglycan-binding domain-containing protein [Alicyclobacillus vulcanalis]SIT07295.1 LysM domain-containing protein [Alicyclobacillus vulcanalis]
MKKYVVKPGESLYQISRKTGVRLPLILAANPQIKNANDITPGMTIVIPELGKGTTSKPKAKKAQSKPAKTSAAAKPYFGYVWPHAVQPGETWESIAERYNVTVEDLEHLNPAIASRALAPGLVVYVPLGTEPPAALSAPESAQGAWVPAPGGGPVDTAVPPMEPSASGILFSGQGHQGSLQQPPTVEPDEGVEPWAGPEASGGGLSQNGAEFEPAEPGEAPWEGTVEDGGPHMHQPYRRAEVIDFPETDAEGWSKPFVVRVGNDR